MAHPPISLDDDRVRALERVAAEEHASLDEVIRRAVDVYLAQRTQDARPWGERLRAVVQHLRAGVPAGMTPAQIEAEITANWDEYRAERAATRNTASGPGRCR